jgi:hypothetical protein
MVALPHPAAIGSQPLAGQEYVMLGTTQILAAIIGLSLRVSRWLDGLPRQAEQRATPMKAGYRVWRLARVRPGGTFWPVL